MYRAYVTVSHLVTKENWPSDKGSIKKQAETYRSEHSEWFVEDVVGGRQTERYSPGLVEQLNKDFGKE